MIKTSLKNILFPALLALATTLLPPDANAQSRQSDHTPIYIVNGVRMSEEEVKDINPADIVTNKLLPADEHTIEQYGEQAANGVIIISLRYDTPARFEVDGITTGYSSYIADRVKWEETDPTARIIISFTVDAQGAVSVKEILEATDTRLKRRILKAMEIAPHWVPALKQGAGVATDHLLKVTLPKGRTMPREKVILIR